MHNHQTRLHTLKFANILIAFMLLLMVMRSSLQAASAGDDVATSDPQPTGSAAVVAADPWVPAQLVPYEGSRDHSMCHVRWAFVTAHRTRTTEIGQQIRAWRSAAGHEYLRTRGTHDERNTTLDGWLHRVLPALTGGPIETTCALPRVMEDLRGMRSLLAPVSQMLLDDQVVMLDTAARMAFPAHARALTCLALTGVCTHFREIFPASHSHHVNRVLGCLLLNGMQHHLPGYRDQAQKLNDMFPDHAAFHLATAEAAWLPGMSLQHMHGFLEYSVREGLPWARGTSINMVVLRPPSCNIREALEILHIMRSVTRDQVAHGERVRNLLNCRLMFMRSLSHVTRLPRSIMMHLLRFAAEASFDTEADRQADIELRRLGIMFMRRTPVSLRLIKLNS